MNTKTPSKEHRKAALRHVLGALLLIALAACGGGGGGSDGGTAASPGTNNPNMVNSGTSPGFITVGTGTPNNTTPPQEPAPATPPPTAPTATPTPTPVPPAPFTCASGSITCVEIASTDSVTQASVPLTFGQPFKAGAWKHQTTDLYATDDLGKSIPVQADDISSHRDGSARFAVISAQLSNLKPGDRRVVSLFAGGTRGAAQKLPAAPDWNLEVVATIYAPQTVKITFGNRSGQTAGTPFLTGETIVISLTSQGVTEKHSLTVSAAQSGGGYMTLQAIATAFANQINEKSAIYAADKPMKSYENFFVRTKDPARGKFDTSFQYNGAAPIVATVLSNYSAPGRWVYKPQSDLVEAIKSGNNTVRFHGPVATEFHLASPLVNEATGEKHPFLTARLDARFYEQGNRSRTDVVLENNWTFKQNPRNIRYELLVTQNGKQLHHQPSFEHFHHARWHKPVWSNESKYVLRHHIQDFFDSKAVHNYDRSLKISETTLSQEKINLDEVRKSQESLGPMASLFNRPDFLSTGGRSDNGPLARWTVLYLLTQDQRAYESMMANINATSGVPIHFRDEATQQPINPIEHATYSTHYNSRNEPPISPDPTIWSPDQAHQASLAYVPYLLTGDRFYLDEMMFWASWNVLNQTVNNRQGALSLLEKDQIRAQAWALRSIGEASRSLPDNHVMKPVYQTMLQNNLDRYYDTYITKGQASPLGAITHLTGVDVSPWQMDYFMTTMSLLAQNNDPRAQEILNWWGRFAVGRFLADEQGFCAARASGYYWPIVKDGNFLTTFKQIFDLAYPADIGKDCSTLKIIEGYPDYHTGYVAYARGALAAAANAGVPDALKAYNKWKSMTPLLDASFATSPNWAIAPRNQQ